MEIVIAALKIISAVVASVLGIWGLFAKTRTEKGRLTKFGRNALGLLILSTLASVGISTFEGVKTVRDSEQQLSRLNAIADKLERASQPITQLEMSIFFKFNLEHEAVRIFFERVHKISQERRDDFLKFGEEKVGFDALLYADGSFFAISIGKNSDLWPRDNELSIIQSVLSRYCVISFSKQANEEGLSNLYSGDFLARGYTEVHSITLNLESNTVSVSASVKFDSNSWTRGEKINSVVDLYGSQLDLGIYYRHPMEFLREADKNSDSHRLFRLFEIADLTLTVDAGREIHLRIKHFKQDRGEQEILYWVVFPATKDGFDRFTSRLSETEN